MRQTGFYRSGEADIIHCYAKVQQTLTKTLYVIFSLILSLFHFHSLSSIKICPSPSKVFVSASPALKETCYELSRLVPDIRHTGYPAGYLVYFQL